MNILFRKFLARLIAKGSLIVTDANGQDHHFGDGSGAPVHIRFATPAAERAIFLHPSLKLGECYMDGTLEMVSGSIYDLLALVFTNSGAEAAVSTRWLKLLDGVRRLAGHFVPGNDRRRSKANVHHHYDLSGELYELFLDRDRQ